MDVSNRNYHHAFVWRISNADVLMAGEYSIASPMFTVENTKWCLNLNFSRKSDEKIHIFALLIRQPDEVAGLVEVMFYLKLHAFDETCLWYAPIAFNQFSKTMNSCGSTFVTNENELKSLLRNDVKNILTISCEMFLGYPYLFMDINSPNFNIARDPSSDFNLSQDLLRLLNEEWLPGDVHFKVEEGQIGAHLDILTFRSSKFRNFFDEFGNPENVLHYSPEAIKLMLVYIYTGGVREIFLDNSLHLELRQLSSQFKLKGLSEILKPQNEVRKETLILPEYFRKMWRIRDVREKLLNPNFFETGRAAIKSIRSWIDVHLIRELDELNSTPSSSHLVFYGEISNLHRVGSLTIKIAIQNKMGDQAFQHVAWLLPKHDCKCRFSFPLPENCIQQIELPDDNLYILFSLKYILKGALNICETTFNVDNTSEENYTDSINGTLSYQMGLFMMSRDYTNIILVAEEREYYVHLSILSARWPEFGQEFSPIAEDGAFRLPISSECAGLLLNYLYTDNVCVRDPEEITSLWQAAYLCYFSRLELKCLEILGKYEHVTSILPSF